MLYAAAISWITLVFQVINVAFPDPLEGGYVSTYYYSTMRGAISWLFVTFPVYIFATRYLLRDYRAHSEKLGLWIRKWLTYFTLFVAALIIIGDIVFLLNTFLAGDLTIRFFFKVLSVLFITGSIFGYYFWDMRQEEPLPAAKVRYFAYGIIAVFIISLACGFIMVGSPQTQRLREADTERANDLMNIQWELITYWQNKGALPETLAPLEESLSGFTVPYDPITKEPYTYEVTGELSFKLCAVFDLSSAEEEPTFDDSKQWDHGAGEVCFDRTIDPDIYKKPDTAVPVPIR